jgi:hypothetical protein
VRRQQTLHASVDWSHALLTEPERVLFRRLAVFMADSTSTPHVPWLSTTTLSAIKCSTHQALGPRHRLVGILRGCLRHHTLYGENTASAHRQTTQTA